jgi:hypothetical protein
MREQKENNIHSIQVLENKQNDFSDYNIKFIEF